MPAGMVRPRPSQVAPLALNAIAAWLGVGWRLTPYGRLDLGLLVGPCARCRAPTVLYGPRGQPLCPSCRTPGSDA